MYVLVSVHLYPYYVTKILTLGYRPTCPSHSPPVRTLLPLDFLTHSSPDCGFYHLITVMTVPFDLKTLKRVPITQWSVGVGL